MTYTVFFALAVTPDNTDICLDAPPGPDGTIPNISYASLRTHGSRVVRLPISAMKCATKEEFVTKVSTMAESLYAELGARCQGKIL